MLILAGNHTPVIPFVEIEGKEGTVAPAHIVKVVPKLNAGVRIGFTVTLKVVVAKHCPGIGVGVKVYIADAWLDTVNGFQVPAIPLSDVVGNSGILPLTQILSSVPKLNVGVTVGMTVTVNVVGVAQNPGAGVNV